MHTGSYELATTGPHPIRRSWARLRSTPGRSSEWARRTRRSPLAGPGSDWYLPLMLRPRLCLGLALLLLLSQVACAEETAPQGGTGGGTDPCAALEFAGEPVTLPVGFELAHDSHQMTLGDQSGAVTVVARMLFETRTPLGMTTLQPWEAWPPAIEPLTEQLGGRDFDAGDYLVVQGPGIPTLVLPDDQGGTSLHALSELAPMARLSDVSLSPTFALRSGGTSLVRLGLGYGPGDGAYTTTSVTSTGLVTPEDADRCGTTPEGGAIASEDGFLSVTYRAENGCDDPDGQYALTIDRYRFSDGPGSSLERTQGSRLPEVGPHSWLTPRGDGAWLFYQRTADGEPISLFARRVDREGKLLEGPPIEVFTAATGGAPFVVTGLGEGAVAGWRSEADGRIHVRMLRPDDELTPELVIDTQSPSQPDAIRLQLLGAPDGSSVLVLFDLDDASSVDQVTGASLLRLDCVPEAAR